MFVYYDPEGNNQIRALYSSAPASTVWADQGYRLLEVPDEPRPSLDKRVVFDKDGKFVNLEEWPRPKLVMSQVSIIDNGIDELVITPEFQDNETHDCEWSIRLSDGQSPFGEITISNKLSFVSEIPGKYEIRCFSNEFGMTYGYVEVLDA